jgi:hypothetical protein
MVEYETGFEDGTLGSLTKTENLGAVTIEQITPAHGSYHARGVSDAGAGSHRARTVYTLTDKTECYMRAYVAVISDPTPEAAKQFTLAGFAGTGGLALFQLFDESLELQCYYRNGAGWTRALTGVTIEQERYYCLEVYCKVGAGDGVAKFWVDGELVGDFEDLDNSTYTLQYVHAGLVLYDGAEAKEVYWDDFAVDSAYIGLIVPPHEKTMAESMSEMINSMMSIMMVMMVMQMMTGMLKKKK